MESSIASPKTVYEQQLINIIRRLPNDRISQVVDFAKFLELQLKGFSNLKCQNELKEDTTEENNRWDKLLARDDSQILLEKMADEALAEINAGLTKTMVFTQDVQIKPE
ncbi:MAG: hypothetical protein HQK72_07665 [Desulfamplus sp.]|nr:hypothetical protein [Desulfamplus sp.]